VELLFHSPNTFVAWYLSKQEDNFAVKLYYNFQVLKVCAQIIKLADHISAVSANVYENFWPVNSIFQEYNLIFDWPLPGHCSKILSNHCINNELYVHPDHLCGLVVRGPGFDSQSYQLF
jgi:hypothetical protein